MKLNSADFENGGELPKEFTCQGEGISPSLSWSEIPEGTKSLTLSLTDPDAPGGNFIHWQIINIPLTVTSINQGETVGEELANSAGSPGYYPPCPPSGKHRYIFTLYALNTDKIDQLKDMDFDSSIKPYIIEKSELLGYYQK